MKKLSIIFALTILVCSCSRDKQVDISNEAFVVSFVPQVHLTDDGKIYFSGKSNLPEGARILISIKDAGQTEVFVSDGIFQSEIFSKLGKPFPVGSYEVTFSFLPNFENVSESVKAKIAKDGSNLKGPDIRKHTFYENLQYLEKSLTFKIKKKKKLAVK